jgi:hypothetical protein
MPKPDGSLTLLEKADARNQAITFAREAQERASSLKRVAAKERSRAGKIFAHPKVQNGTAIQLGIFLATQTDLSLAECHAALDQSLAGDPEKVHPEAATGLYESGRAAAQRLTDPAYSESRRREIQAESDAGFESELARRGGRPKDNRTDREKQQQDDWAAIANRAKNKDENSQDDSDLRSMGFGGGAQFERGSYDAGASAARAILGKSPTTAPRPAYAPPSAGSQRAPTSAPSDDATYSAGAAAARHLLGDMSAVRAEADNELRSKFADQQARRAQQN